MKQRELVRIGIDRPVAHAVRSPSGWSGASAPTASYPRVTHVEMATALKGNAQLRMLNLRRSSEFDDGYVLETVDV
ncbi:MAG: hypothetical protein O2943_04175 [Actinomycetota bacterium]|nr:hypothetical protein [Actinomycetota bacterium]